MIRIKHSRAHAAIIIWLLTSACATKQITVNGQTALQKTIIYNAAVVKAVAAAEQGIEDAVVKQILTVDQARPLIVGCGKVMQKSIAITAITSKGSDASWNVDGPKIRALLTGTPLQIPASANPTIDLLIQTANSAVAILAGVK